MAKGDYILFTHVPFQAVTSHPRRYGVMFNPSSSRSRLRIRDSGRRYAVRLRADGVVEYSIDGEVTWKTITPLADPCTGQRLPQFVSHDNLRTGEPLTNVTFDMIAVGRGHIIGKETGTDRLFHVYMDEIFRSPQARCNVGELNQRPVDDYDGQVTAEDFQDPPVPPFHMKLDPESFTTDAPSIIVPPEATRNYFNHPASARLPVFSQVLELDVSDGMLVTQRARTWYLKDTRSQLAIIAKEEFEFREQDLIEVFTKDAILDILVPAKAAAKEMTDNGVAALLVDWMVNTEELAQKWRAQILNEGFGVVIFPIYIALGVFLYGAGNSNAFQTEPGGRARIDLLRFLNFLKQPVGNPKSQPFIDEATAKLMELLGQLIIRARRAALQRYGDRGDVNRVELPPDWTLEKRLPTPNQPPAWMPVYVRSSYIRRKGPWRAQWRKFYSDNDQLRQVWLAANTDGTLEAFGLDPTNQALKHTSQRSLKGGIDGNWEGSWAPLFTTADTVKRFASVRNANGRIEIFRTATDNRVFHTTQTAPNTGSFGGWQELYTSNDRRISIAAEVNLDGRLEVFAVAEDNQVFRTSQTSPGTWLGKWELTYSSADKLRDVWLARNADGTLEAFGISSDNRIWHTRQLTPGAKWNGSWTELYSAADKLRTLAVGRNANGSLELIGVAPDETVWRTSQDTAGNWNGRWVPFFSAGDKLRDVWLMGNTDGRLEAFGVSANNRVWHTWQTAPNGEFNGIWEEIDTNSSRTSLAAAPSADGSVEVIGVSPDFFSEHAWRLRIPAEKRFAIQFSKVLDLGIGVSHWAENWLAHFGGEIQSLPATRPLFQDERYNLIQYRFLNGPVIDGDAFNDGTTNFYVLVKLGAPNSDGAGFLQRYAILWFDEQTYFTQRWRLLHPTDDILGDLFSLGHAMRDNPEWFNFELAKYWDPFRADLIDDNSRMALRRNIIVVTGFNPAQQRHEIYTIVFNYGLCDHSWRWRLFPAAQQVLINPAIAQEQNPQLPAEVSSGPANAYVVVNTIDLRDDTTLHVRGSLRSPVTQTLRVGRWVQRYLPADCRHVPERHELTGQKPAAGFTHKWDFVTETVYQRADRFYQLGVYEHLLDSRGQYYEVELLPGPNGVTPRVEDVLGRVWKNDATIDGEDRLRMNTINFNWALPRENGAIIRRMQADDPNSPELYVHDFRHRPSISMYEPTARFRILERKPLGLIAVFFDKRDDDLQPASHLPQPTTLRHDVIESSIPDSWKIEDGETPVPPPTDPAFFNIRVMFKSNHRVVQPPNVRKARIVVDNAPGLRRLHVSFWTPQTEQEVCENIWKVSLAAFNQNGAVFPIFSVTRFPNFVRRAVPDAPAPSNFAGDLGDQWRYDFDFDFAKDVESDVRRFCTQEGHIEFGASLWFENIVGHRALAQELIFA